MAAPIHLPVLRAGTPYESLNKTAVSHIQTGEPLVDVSQANRGLAGRDLSRMESHRQVLAEVPVADLIAMSKSAAESFVNDTLPVGAPCRVRRGCPKPSSAGTWTRFTRHSRRWI